MGGNRSRRDISRRSRGRTDDLFRPRMTKVVERATQFERRQTVIGRHGRYRALELAFDLNERETMEYSSRVNDDNFRVVEALRMGQGRVSD